MKFIHYKLCALMSQSNELGVVMNEFHFMLLHQMIRLLGKLIMLNLIKNFSLKKENEKRL